MVYDPIAVNVCQHYRQSEDHIYRDTVGCREEGARSQGHRQE